MFTPIGLLRFQLLALTVVSVTILSGSPGCSGGKGGSRTVVGSLILVTPKSQEEFTVGVRTLELHNIYGMDEQPFMILVDLATPVTKNQFSKITESLDKSTGLVFVKVELFSFDGFRGRGRLVGVLSKKEVQDLEAREEITN